MAGGVDGGVAGVGAQDARTSELCTARGSAEQLQNIDDVEDLLAPLDVDGFRNLDKNHTEPSEVPNNCGAWPSTVNMYEDVLPSPKTRVTLAVFNKEPETDYINANFVRDRAGNMTWIAAQGPLDTTVNAFWRMIWEKSVPVIVMLTRTMEGGVKKCAKYLPKSVGVAEQRGLFKITLDSFGAFPEDQARQTCFKSFLTMSLRKKDGTVETRRVIHFWLNSWPDHGRPANAAHMLTLAASIRTLRTAAKSKVQRPTVVHCSAGVGRTGTFISMIDVLDAVHSGEKVDILQIITRLRQDRCRMVTSVMQYEFLWDAAYEYICVGGNVLKHRVKTLPTISKGINPGFTLSGPTSVHVGNVNDELLNAFFIKSVKPGSVAANAGFEAGDRIDEISHDGIPMGRGGKKLAFRLHGKTLGQVTAEILRGISTQQPVHFKVSKQKIAMEAQQQLKDEEEAEARHALDVEEEDESAPKVQRRIAQMKALYKREKELEEDEADEDAFVEAVEEYEEQQDREYEERVLKEMEELATEKAEEYMSMDASAARMNSAELKNEVISRYVGRALGVQDSFDPDAAYLSSVRIDADEEESQVIEKETSFTSVDKQNWNDSQFMSHMFGYKRSKSYTQAQMEGAIRAPAEINPEILSAKGIKEITPKEAEAAGVPRYIFRKIDTNHDGKVSVQELRKASLDGLLTIQELEAEAAAAAAGPQAGPAESQGRRRESARGSRKWSTTSNVAVGITIEPEASAGPSVGEPGTPFREMEFVEPGESELNSPPPVFGSMLDMGQVGIVADGDHFVPVVEC
eukprot:m.455589 g.455589  ORF g.455589 m.455589 type:complete len:799 (-) comp20898_c0_seq1:233-2629(-)